ncbi:MAG: NADH-quinone oxidoreductase subunit C [Saprospiraceae bacterium]|nr:NADH-quinone oxidoreductase subunit C [Saprospiraceae bacterium]
MDHSRLLDLLNLKFPGHIQVLIQADGKNIPSIEIPREQIKPVLDYLKSDPQIAMSFLTDLCGVHYPDQAGKELGVVYHLHSFVHNLRLRIKAFGPIDDPQFPSVTDLYAAANWMERETYDFFGIQFQGHPDLRRILNVDEMDYFPLRKEYPLEDRTRKDKDDRYFGRQGHEGVDFDKRIDRQ